MLSGIGSDWSNRVCIVTSCARVQLAVQCDEWTCYRSAQSQWTWQYPWLIQAEAKWWEAGTWTEQGDYHQDRRCYLWTQIVGGLFFRINKRWYEIQMRSWHSMCFNEVLRSIPWLRKSSTMMHVFVFSSTNILDDVAKAFNWLSTSWMKLMKVAGPLVGPKGITD